MRDVHWFEVTEKLRDSHLDYTGPSDGLQRRESQAGLRIIHLRGIRIYQKNIFLKII